MGRKSNVKFLLNYIFDTIERGELFSEVAILYNYGLYNMRIKFEASGNYRKAWINFGCCATKLLCFSVLYYVKHQTE